ncbi:multifunctional oxoglutarate decarboxylase/oxoglutarate dehydrogenase thiamine pyrophosphate-binding subunit/dihydrolipoyllysine-residue succinyltransferase subunit [Gleimia sp. 6138-11-ORH1]|uniref:multifunctional oxoglutarate decarboxylase/oxoglutarate dehydrogenase thiamine pyrophosphate-binding subunit/dihydrolipoyllysine-residue succinyltransferase subunit n=1 Tax=Gleimia sp. 6138-11-ORH1 TaxID=2973937 RepID=UPI002169D251|nr:multifunctional oxoglutarate decarboxylase/oxoglutarate dehydrogenase thiamine pyrophosphate-binding subunit/dihydrolipoyllysine-residue succinyltransferase subunit [Gleimia sp. 6138-11-ORH1]MCS4484075.1 multifunctional oxoglutarate decarboxylase/oxoglutarate dehydrogenase thiamine pyrophosphate-binding subunit/dihydrolipoyllysine-residue succinyltransferase subunit [Gleimia sp. 6138-11-ORH1]
MEEPNLSPFGTTPPPPTPPSTYVAPHLPKPKEVVSPAHDYPYAPIQDENSEANSAANIIDVTRSDLPPRPRSAIAEATSPYARQTGQQLNPRALSSADSTEALKGIARTVAKNMESSLEVPTATSVRQLSAKLLIENRELINSYLALSHGGKVSFTHLIGYALVEALTEAPSLNVRYTLDENGKPAIQHLAHVGFGLAIDVPKADGTRTLLVPVLKDADTLNFSQFVRAYDELVVKARTGKLAASDFTGGTVTLTNPGTIGTTHSVPRLMQGQGLIIGVGATEYPAEWAGASPERLAEMAIGKIMTLTSTYDHRVIQGAGSGELLRTVVRKLTGQENFYERVFDSMKVPYSPYGWQQDLQRIGEANSGRIMQLIHAYRSRGHLAADTDPLAYKIRRHPDLDISHYGLTVWDLNRTFDVNGFRGRKTMTLREILQQLRESYTRTVGVEYMHIQDPAQRHWMQDKLERPWMKPTLETQRHTMTMLNKAEAFEHFLQTKYIGQKRFSLEGGESLIPLLDRIVWVAAHSNIAEVAIGMAHRGRLNVLANIAGKSYAQIFSEFEGNHDPRTVQGSGDVKYHLGTEGIFSATDGYATKVSLAANPSHLEAVDGVLQGIVRAKHDKLNEPDYPVLPILIHGDAAFIGQGVVYETLNMSQLKAYRNGGTLHVIVNNQIGFTTSPTSGRSTRYCTDLAKGLQVPIFHVNADDPEMVVRVGKLALEFRQAFHKDVIIDLVCYRRRGHNEGDDPSMTQPVMYDLIGRTPTTRDAYTADLIGRGDITAEDAAAALEEYNDLLNQILSETRQNNGHAPESEQTVAGLEQPESQRLGQGLVIGWQSAITTEMIERIGDAHVNIPAGFTPHPKMVQLFEKRQQMTRQGNIDWGFGELLAFGSLLMEGTPVRMSGQDARRATFVQRHATLHDYTNGSEWTPLNFLVEGQPPFEIYDSSLSEYAPLAFEYGYSVERPEALVLWEAQFGDFANGAQTVLDEFISSAEQKWAQRSSVTLLLPHGYEGQGPDHSSARIERYLGLCAEENMWVVQPSTPANHFHMLRTQAYKRPRKPLIVFTPKQLLRLPEAVSAIADFTSGGFQPVIPEVDAHIKNQPAAVDRVILCSGRLYYELVKERQRLADTATAIIRLEQYYPLPTEALLNELANYPQAELFWVQDEPKNQGAYPFLALNLFPELGRPVKVVSRPAAASPSAGTMALHKYQAEQLRLEAFSR